MAWQKIHLYGAGADSGTFDYFTEAIVGKAKSGRGDFSASEDAYVLVQGVAGDQYALGFFGFAYYSENSQKVNAVGVDSGEGAVFPSAVTIKMVAINRYHALYLSMLVPNQRISPKSKNLFIFIWRMHESLWLKSNIFLFLEKCITSIENTLIREK